MLNSLSLRATVSSGALLCVAACGSATAAHPSAFRGTSTPSAVTPSSTPPALSLAPSAVPAPPAAVTPLLVQVENLAGARPQSGLSQAELLYEYQTEGGISRFTAVYLHPPAGRLGPIRSARLATITLLRVWGGSLLYSGASTYVSRLLRSSGLHQFDEVGADGTMFRVANRYAPHNLYTDAGHVDAFAQRTGLRLSGSQIWARTPVTALPPGASPLGRFQVPVSQSELPLYSYNPARGTYVRAEPDTGLFTDAVTGGPLQPSTVVLLQMPVTVGPEVEDTSGAHGLDFGLVGSGAGQVAVGGRVFAIRWTQPVSGPPQLTLADGQPAPIAPGQVIIELVRPGQMVQPR